MQETEDYRLIRKLPAKMRKGLWMKSLKYWWRLRRGCLEGNRVACESCRWAREAKQYFISFCFCTLIFTWNAESAGEQENEIKRLPTAHSLNASNARARPGWHHAQVLHLCLSHGCQGPKSLSHPLLPARDWTARKLEWEMMWNFIWICVFVSRNYH